MLRLFVVKPYDGMAAYGDCHAPRADRSFHGIPHFTAHIARLGAGQRPAVPQAQPVQRFADPGCGCYDPAGM